MLNNDIYIKFDNIDNIDYSVIGSYENTKLIFLKYKEEKIEKQIINKKYSEEISLENVFIEVSSNNSTNSKTENKITIGISGNKNNKKKYYLHLQCLLNIGIYF